jgi:hypothetical protein
MSVKKCAAALSSMCEFVHVCTFACVRVLLSLMRYYFDPTRLGIRTLTYSNSNLQTILTSSHHNDVYRLGATSAVSMADLPLSLVVDDVLGRTPPASAPPFGAVATWHLSVINHRPAIWKMSDIHH